jgi:hypothetical protein
MYLVKQISFKIAWANQYMHYISALVDVHIYQGVRARVGIIFLSFTAAIGAEILQKKIRNK